MKIKLLISLLSLVFIGSIYSMQDPNEMLIRGAEGEGDIKLVQEALKEKADVNYKNIYGFTALMIAADNGHESIVKLLLENGADPDLQNDEDDTALILAASHRCRHDNIVELLLDGGANPDIKGGENNATALMWAIPDNCKSIVELLLHRGVNLDIKDKTGDTALMWAVYNNYPLIVKLLLEAGVSLDLKNNKGEAALDIAKRKKYKSIADLIKKEYEKREKLRQDVKKIVESGYLLPELAEIVSEYAVCSKEKRTL